MYKIIKLKKYFFLIFFFSFTFSFSKETDINLKKLSQNKIWLNLLHYKNGKSEIDDKSFFLSKDGYKDPYKELISTIKAFESYEKDDNKHPVCVYPARYYFLKKYVNLNLKIKPTCKKLNEFLKKVNPYKVYIVFSDAYINSPASMYGHTFLKITSKNSPDLLSHAINYAAEGNPTDGIKYYFKGVFGLYKGYFGVFLYYKKIFEYNNLESRDLWEYELNIPKDKVHLITLHIWELKDKYIYYYFFNKNCSYHILHILNLASDEENFTDYYNFWVIPIDTVRLLKEKGLIKSKKYRASMSNRIKAFLRKYQDISEEDVELAKNISSLKINPKEILKSKFPIKKKAEILELSKLIFLYNATKNKIPEKKYKKNFLKILSARSKIKYRLNYWNFKEKNKPSADEGHRSSKLAVGYGVEKEEDFISLEYRTAYHGLEDLDKGYIFGSEIIFPSLRIKYFTDKNKTVLDEFNLITIKSYAIRDKIFKPISWNIFAKFKRDWNNTKNKDFFFKVFGGTGLTYGKENKYLIYFGIKNGIAWNLKGANNSFGRLGGNFLFLYKIRENKFILDFYPFINFSKENYTGYNLDLKFSFPLKTNSSINLKSRIINIDSNVIYETDLNLNFFF